MNEHRINPHIPLRPLEAIERLASIGEYTHYEDLLDYIADLQEQIKCVEEDLRGEEKERVEQSGYIQDLEADLENAEIKISELEEKLND